MMGELVREVVKLQDRFHPRYTGACEPVVVRGYYDLVISDGAAEGFVPVTGMFCKSCNVSVRYCGV